MFCPHCRVHYSGGGDEARCPYCGREGEPSRSTPAASAPAQTSPPPADPDRTRTEAGGEGPWAPGAVIAEKYEVISQLGSGGFGSVYKVRHIFRKKHYALKTPHSQFSRDEVFRRRFEREIEAMERFVHPDAVMIRDSGVTAEGHPYYTMDFIEGESLKDILRREGKLSPERAVPIVLRVLRVLDVSHSHGIVHRDIKPDNILLTGVNGREGVKVLDFGVAKLLDLVGESKNLTRGDRVGTPRYMSPEQITGEPTEPRSDLFSLGIVFYEMVTGRHPFASTGANDGQGEGPLTDSILNRSPVPPREIITSLSRAISDQILCLLEKKARRRPASAAAVIRDLEALPEGALPRASAAARLSLHPGFPRARALPLVLREPTPEGERRCFLFFQDEVRMGRSNDRARGIVNDALIRCLPCRSRTADPDNWLRNLTISQHAATLSPAGEALHIDPAPGVKHGIGVGGVKSYGRIRIQGERFHLTLGDRAIEIDGYRVETPPGTPLHDLGFLEAGRPQGLAACVRSGHSNASCGIDSVSLIRANNWPLHEYHLVFRVLRLGPAAGTPLRMRQSPAPDVLVIHEAGEAFLLALGRGSRAAPPAASDETAPEVELAENVLYPLAPGMRLSLGDNRFTVALADEADFKMV
jgi:serine/threonine protein kinase